MTDPRQHKYLSAMGIPVWVSRELVLETSEVEDSKVTDIAKQHGADVPETMGVEDESPCVDSASSIIEKLDSTSATPKKSKNKKVFNQEFTNKKASNTSETIVDINVENLSTLDWQALQQKVSNCQQCDLHKNRSNTVFGNGHHQADWMIIGDAPAFQDDQQGQAFTDQAGQLLTNMLRAIGLKRDEVYITNLLKCRPPNNRDPERQEVISCNAYLQRQIELIKPKIVLAFGQVATQNLLQTNEPLARLRGKVHQLPDTGISLVATYHPAYLLKKTIDKRKAWDDLKLAKQQLDQETL